MVKKLKDNIGRRAPESDRFSINPLVTQLSKPPPTVCFIQQAVSSKHLVFTDSLKYLSLYSLLFIAHDADASVRPV